MKVFAEQNWIVIAWKDCHFYDSLAGSDVGSRTVYKFIILTAQ